MSKIDLLQSNLNHCARAQDLFLHTLTQYKCGVGIAADLHRISPNHPCWARDDQGSIAITWKEEVGSSSCIKIGAGRHHVAVEWGPVWMVGCYIPPSIRDLTRFGDVLDEIAVLVQRRLSEPIIVAGDFNVWNRLWGFRHTNGNGRVMKDWAAVLTLVLINQGSNSTLVRPQRESIVDLTWASPSAADRIANWR
ncbi:uncharacterized protein [Anoplolepis gracilipes]|uniref:uncharacterized protein n=1 Tax=Anoplolepis gracilipes TaxID=354296 RepID=UPI003B9EA5A4